ncbi:uncharacterized protein LOC115632230 [Scaptodrosophila lebanonensis]|uniref:Uncharacterized protein LOC115632230 n=1 Tax=Drosophila lebanonensis TaxID=7225 RepID=A0A6J2UAV3_DROLE|nr:uncharacterized protein LOC115632230 [Scaptodrosophila lebanonensis]
MVAFYDGCVGGDHPQTLSDWVRNFRLKRVQMRRKLRGAGSDLRVCAILSTALSCAEQQLRRKQQERFTRWLDMQAKFVPHGKTHCASDANANAERYDRCDDVKLEEERREIENSLWKSELSGLDDFMRSLSSSNSQNYNCNGSSSSSSYNNNTQQQCAIAVNS